MSTGSKTWKINTEAPSLHCRSQPFLCGSSHVSRALKSVKPKRKWSQKNTVGQSTLPPSPRAGRNGDVILLPVATLNALPCSRREEIFSESFHSNGKRKRIRFHHSFVLFSRNNGVLCDAIVQTFSRETLPDTKKFGNISRGWQTYTLLAITLRTNQMPQ